MINVQCFISNKLSSSYSESMIDSLDYINSRFVDKDILFKHAEYEFTEIEERQIKENPDDFLNLGKRQYLEKKRNAYIYVPDTSINLKNNYMWYSTGIPEATVMIISSYIFKNVINEKISFGDYVLMVYSQYLARFTVKFSQPHSISRSCLNDYCASQIEILNVLKNDNVLCDECSLNIQNKSYYHITKKIVTSIKAKSPKKIGVTKLDFSVTVLPKSVPVNVEVEFSKGFSYEIEIFMAKKCLNLSELYKKLDGLIKNPSSAIDGYSLYEVDGGWRGDVVLSKAKQADWSSLCSLRKKFGESDFKDLIKPIVERGGGKFAIFDEGSMVLKIIITSSNEILVWDENSHLAIREIKNIFKEITRKEKSVFFTMKKLEKKGYIKRKIK